MTTDHLDDEAISAHLDGEATPAEAEHVDGCETCTARLAELRAASEAVGSPVDLGFADRDAAVAAAMAAAPASNIAPMASRRRRQAPPQWLAAAAALLVVVALVPVLGSLRGGGDDADETAASGEAQEDATTFDAESSGGSELAAAPFDAGDIGEVDVGGLRALVEEAVTAPQTAMRAEESDDDAQEEAEVGGGVASAAPAADAVPALCEDASRTDFPEMGALRYRAVGTFQGEEVSVLAFELPAEVQRIRILVRAVDDCAIRNVQELEPS